MWTPRHKALALVSTCALIGALFLFHRSPDFYASGVLIRYRSFLGFPHGKILYPYTEENCQPPPEVVLKPLDGQDLCPPTIPSQHGLTITRRPTFILTPSNDRVETWDTSNRTTFMPDQPQSTLHEEVRNNEEPNLSQIGFLGWAPRSKDAQPNWPRRFRTEMDPEERCPVFQVPAYVEPDFLQASHPIKTFIPSLGRSPRGCRPIATRRLGCMFGFATTPARTLKYLPRWYDWLNNTQSVEVETIMVLQSPKEIDSDKKWETEMIAKAIGLPIRIKIVPAKRFELRYMKLLKHMWLEAMQRESEGHHRTDWFILADDDTYFLSLDSMSRILSKYNPLESHLVGASSESQRAISAFGRIAFGGAGIFFSRGLMSKINAPGAFERCLEFFGEDFGGDSMVTKCAIKLTSNSTFKAEPTLHQLDIRDEGHGIFQAGLQFTTIHHWDSWFQLQPRAHPHTLKNNLELVALLGKAARIVGAENWTRRYVWGFNNVTNPELVAKSGAVVISLGYSITIFANSVLKQSYLNEVEHTFAAEHLVLKTRPALLETRQRRTYYLKSIKMLENSNDLVAVLTHVNQEGELIDLVWDKRPRPKLD